MGLAKTAARGYGGDHQALRRKIAPLVARGQCRCERCGLVIEPGEPWDLGHIPGTRVHRGPEHRRCNRATNRRWMPAVSVRL